MHDTKLHEEWQILIAAMRNAMSRQFSPRDQVVQELARHWMDLLRRTAMEDPDILHDYDGSPLRAPDFPLARDIDSNMLDYLSTALWAKHLSLEESQRLRPNGPHHRNWPYLLSALREEMNRGTSAANPTVQQLFRQWESGVDELTAGDAELRHKWMTAIRSDPALLAGLGIDMRLQNYLQRARLVREGLAALLNEQM